MTEKNIILCVLLFFISLAVHLIGINQIGRTWDEQFKVDAGYMAWNNLTEHNFSVKAWNFGTEHPMVAKYIYGFFIGPQMTRLDDGNGKLRNNLSFDESNTLRNQNFILTGIQNKLFAVSYDFSLPRIVSAIFNSLGVVLTGILAMFILEEFWFVAGLLLIFIPRFLVMGQLVTYESVSLFIFCLTALFFYKLLTKPAKTKYYVYVGILSGLLFWTHYNNVNIFVFLAGWIVLHIMYQKTKKVINPKLLLIPVIAFFIGIIIWPLMWHEFPKYLISTFTQNMGRSKGPSFYYLNHLFVTTPVPIIAGFIIGFIISLKERKYWNAVFLWYFLSTLIFFSLLCDPMNGTRYIFVIYTPIAVLCAYGYWKIFKKKLLYATAVLLVLMILELSSVFPYYLDYYNQFVGGAPGALKQKYDISWWGEGQREVGYWINDNLPEGATVGLLVTPKYVFPQLRRDLKNMGYINVKTDADYLVVSRYNTGDLTKEFLQKHNVIYKATVQSVPLVFLYKKI